MRPAEHHLRKYPGDRLSPTRAPSATAAARTAAAVRREQRQGACRNLRKQSHSFIARGVIGLRSEMVRFTLAPVET